MPTCAHLYCHYSTRNYKTPDGKKLSFHRFPRDAKARQIWLDKLDREGFKPNSRSVICSKHFDKSCFDKKSNKHPRLLFDAIPTLFLRDGIKRKVEKKEKEEEEEQLSDDEDTEVWSGWHSWPDKDDETKEGERRMDASKGLEELEKLMDEEMEERIEGENDEDGTMGSKDGDGGKTGPPEQVKETNTYKAVGCVTAQEKLSLDNITMDSTLKSVRVGDKKVVSMTFQDMLNSLITSQPADTSKKDHQDAASSEEDQGQKTNGDGKSRTTPVSLISPEFLKSLKRKNKATAKNKEKEAKRQRKDEEMVITIYRRNTMTRVISSNDLPYICGDCGSAFTHASVLKLHAEQKHDYTEPTEMKENGAIVSQVVIQRNFETEGPRTKAEVKDLQKKYAQGKVSNSHGESAPARQWLEKLAKSNIYDSDDDDGAAWNGNNSGNSDSDGDSLQRTSSKPKRKQNRKAKERCHRCPRHFPNKTSRKEHIAKEHEEYPTQEAAQESWCKKTGKSIAGLEVLKCIYCHTFFTDRRNAEEHLTKHCGIDGLKCDVCQQAIKLWHEGKNLELGDLRRKYEGIEEDVKGQEEGVIKEAECDEGCDADNEKRASEESTKTVDRTEKEEYEDLLRQCLEKTNSVSNKNYFIVKCSECNEEFFLRHHLNNHYKEHDKYTCKECGEEFKTMTDYQEHLDIIHKVGMCPCLYCPKKFPSIGKLNYHMLGHLGLFQCILCGLTFMSKQSLSSHIRLAVKDPNHRNRRQSDEECVKYSSSNPYLSQGTFGRTRMRHRTVEKKELPCQFCERKFSYAHGLRKHMRSSHPKEELPFMEGDGFCCETCGIVLATKGSFEYHLKTHQERNIPCPQAGCEAMFTTKANLYSHLKNHESTLRPFKCDICQRTFKTKPNLESHKKHHFNESGDHKCSYCSKTFHNITHMIYHEKRMHTGQLDHKCEVCGKGFADPSTLKVHLKTHSTYRPFKCDFCPRDFPTELYLKAHRRVHTKPFKCPQCGEGFAQQGPRRNHVKRVHGIEMPVERKKFRSSAHNKNDQQDEDIPQIAGVSMQDMNEAETLVISQEDKDENDMITKLLEGML